MTLSLNEYQKSAFSTAIYPECGTGSLLAITYCGLGLGESGECQGKIKKILRDDNGILTKERKEEIIGELGGQLWYIGALATELDVTLEEIASKNLATLASRQERGVLHGSGDNR